MKKSINKGCLYSLIFFLTLLGGCSIYLQKIEKDFPEQSKNCLVPLEVNEPNNILLKRYEILIPREFKILDAYDTRRCSFNGDGETIGIFQLSSDTNNIQELINIDGLKWFNGPINEIYEIDNLYRFAFTSLSYYLENFNRPALPKNLIPVTREELINSKSSFHIGSCQNSKKEEFIPCGNGYLMIFNTSTKLLYVSKFDS